MCVIQLVAKPLGQMAVSFKARPGDYCHHMEAVPLRESGKRILGALVTFLRHGTVAFDALSRGESAVVHRMLKVRPALLLASSQYKKLLVSGEDDEKPIICGDCGKRHASEDDVKRLRGSLVCATDCGVLAAGRRYKRPVSVSELASSKRATPTAAPGLLREEPPAIDERNAGCYPPPHLPQHRGADARGPGSAPYVWYRQMTGRAFDGETASYQLARKDYKARHFSHDRESQGTPPGATTREGGASAPPPSAPPILPPPTPAPSPPPAAAAPAVLLTPPPQPPSLSSLPPAPPRPARPLPAPLASTSTLPVVSSAIPRLSLGAPPRVPMAPSLAVPHLPAKQPAPPPASEQQAAAGAPSMLPVPLALRAPMLLASPAVSIRRPANATTPKTGDAAKRIVLIKNVDPQSDRDSGEIRARLMEMGHGPWKNSNGEGSRARMIVADATGDLQITAFEGVDALVARLRVNTAYRFPLAGAVIKLKDEKWNRTTGSAYEVKLSKLGVQHVREEDDERGLPAHNFTFVSIAAIGQLAAGTHVHVLGVIVATSGVVTAPNKVKGTETSRRMLKIADASGPERSRGHHCCSTWSCVLLHFIILTKHTSSLRPTVVFTHIFTPYMPAIHTKVTSRAAA